GDLPVDDVRVDDPAGILHTGPVQDAELGRFRVDLDPDDLGTGGERTANRVVEAGFLQARLDAFGQPVGLQVRDPADLGQADRGPRVAVDVDLPAGQRQLIGLGVQPARGQPQGPVADRLPSALGCSPADDRLPG